MRYIDLCPTAQKRAKQKIIEQTVEFKQFKFESESKLEQLVKNSKIELSFSIGATLLELKLIDSESTIIAMVHNGILDIHYSSFSRITTNVKKANTIRDNIMKLLRKDLFKIDKEREIMLNYVPSDELNKHSYDSLGNII